MFGGFFGLENGGLSSNKVPEQDTVKIDKPKTVMDDKRDVQPPPLILPTTPQVAAVDERYITLYDSYYSDLPATRSDNNLPSELIEAITLYRNGSYEESLKAFPKKSKLEELLDSYPSTNSKKLVEDNYQLYKGLNQLGLKDYQAAINTLDKVSFSTENIG